MRADVSECQPCFVSVRIFKHLWVVQIFLFVVPDLEFRFCEERFCFGSRLFRIVSTFVLTICLSNWWMNNGENAWWSITGESESRYAYFWLVVCFFFSLLILLLLLLVPTLDVLIVIILWKCGDRILWYQDLSKIWLILPSSHAALRSEEDYLYGFIFYGLCLWLWYGILRMPVAMIWHLDMAPW